MDKPADPFVTLHDSNDMQPIKLKPRFVAAASGGPGRQTTIYTADGRNYWVKEPLDEAAQKAGLDGKTSVTLTDSYGSAIRLRPEFIIAIDSRTDAQGKISSCLFYATGQFMLLPGTPDETEAKITAALKPEFLP